MEIEADGLKSWKEAGSGADTGDTGPEALPGAAGPRCGRQRAVWTGERPREGAQRG